MSLALARDSATATAIIAAIRAATGAGEGGLVLHEPRFRGNEWTYLKDCLDSTFVSSVGAYVDRFERDLAAVTGARHAVAVVNGTAALHVALLLAGVAPGDEVIVPTLTFIATANAVSYCGAVPHFADSAMDTLGLDPDKLGRHLDSIVTRRDGQAVNRETGRRIAAIVPVHVFGHPADMAGIEAVAARFGISVVEDATEALGSLSGGRPVGATARLAVLSFNGNKVITTGGGGAILTDDPDLARRAKHMTTTAKVPHRWAYEHDMVGFNYRLPNLNAALGCAQLEQLPGFVASKRALAARYADAFAGVNGVSLIREPAGTAGNYWLNAILLDPELAGERDAILDATNAAGLMTRPVWNLMHGLAIYRDCPRMDLGVAEDLARRIINIPSSAGLVPADG
ncbi:MAG: LegC family aminotransferase [Pseudomonadota bacterium]|nr:LegC family aminotransferase [Pseudomonadota bacterium]